MVRHAGNPELTQAEISLTDNTLVYDEYGQTREISIAGERPLTLYLNKREIVTLMTLGAEPEALVLGYLRNQGMIQSLDQVQAVQVDWEVGAAVVVAESDDDALEQKLAHKTVTTGCGQGTQYGAMMDDLQQLQLSEKTMQQSAVYQLLTALNDYNETYRSAGAVHGCALCSLDQDHKGINASVLAFSEDVGRHNAVDTLAGKQWLHNLQGEQLVFYTTGRLTSEMVIKVARMGISVLLSRSGVTAMGLELARQLGIMLIARAKGKHFLLYHGADRFKWDAVPEKKPSADAVKRHKAKSAS
ncbi:formate dehydrogenase accessory sulfurtransferase FdhD [Oceanospirillum sediminis]|uniref:Sulfur carrier protein FdhD n=1 Tax=Oceanospirillum sediminis TaxID=2760088 RepID=A0A839IVN9_9GAMM|nr:formate dehydrogenase accessory sulfurtransferase FdhD [Oceanospirillum sediminis]MBB1489041.1 formate dehydrogenase accessory sulfurtransferase FdhD [Oceanospirillum sediminis]